MDFVRLGVVFPGQGAQFVGMGKKMCDDFVSSARIFAQADDALDESLSRLCWEGPEEQLMLTENAQPAILATSIACLAPLQEYGLRAYATAGLSLGEYAALVCAESLEFKDAVRLVKNRGHIMQNAVPVGVGAMAAVLGLSPELVTEACKRAGTIGIVQPANFNCPGQVVISGEKQAVECACEVALELGARRVVRLDVSAPFHCSLLEPAVAEFLPHLEATHIRNADIPVIANATANEVRTPDEIRSALRTQIAQPVLWEQSVRKMLEIGIRVFIEVGPGKSLSGFLKKIEPDAKCYHYEDRKTLETVVESIGGRC